MEEERGRNGDCFVLTDLPPCRLFASETVAAVDVIYLALRRPPELLLKMAMTITDGDTRCHTVSASVRIQ